MHVPLVELRSGDRVHLPITTSDEGLVGWSEPVTVTSVLLIDSGLVQVRWEADDDDGSWHAHALLIGPAYAAGAIRVP